MRSFSATFRNELEASSSEEHILVLLKISDSSGLAPARVVSDTVDYLYDDGAGEQRYVGFPFVIELLSDDGRPPRGRLTIQNVDARIGARVRLLTEAPSMILTVLASADFGAATGDPKTRSAIGTPAIEYQALHLALRNIKVDAMAVSADIVSYDYTSEPWPAIRSTPNLLPGLAP